MDIQKKWTRTAARVLAVVLLFKIFLWNPICFFYYPPKVEQTVKALNQTEYCGFSIYPTEGFINHGVSSRTEYLNIQLLVGKPLFPYLSVFNLAFSPAFQIELEGVERGFEGYSLPIEMLRVTNPKAVPANLSLLCFNFMTIPTLSQ